MIVPAAATTAALLVLAGISRTPPAPPPDVLGPLRRAVQSGVTPPPTISRPPSPVPLPALKPTPDELLCETAAELATDPALRESEAGRALLEALWQTVEGCLEDEG